MTTAFFTNYHARVESVEETKSYKDLINSNRCVVPANGFNEWDLMEQGYEVLEKELCYYAAMY